MNSEKLLFKGFPEHDVYNITAPFDWLGKTIIAGRVEKRDEELSQIIFFEKSGDTWNSVEEGPCFPGLQDPCITRIDGKILLGGVRFPVRIGENGQAWQMEFYLENGEGSFDKLLTGPPKMKDIRFLQLPDRRILVLTRPQGEKGGRGKIGYCVVNTLGEATHEAIEEAPLFDHCPEEVWVGANEAHNLKNGNIGVLGHIAEFSEGGDRHYHSMVFSIDLKTGVSSLPEVIAKRSDFPDGVSKREDLQDVIFSGGILRKESGQALLYAGLSDAEAGCLELKDPFLGFEK